jgi:serine/threonine protein kinase
VSRTSDRDAGPPELPGYRFIRPIGAGGNAEVYLYEQELPSRRVAVKVLNDSALSAAARRRFTAEANVTAVLAHRHIVQVFDAKVTDDGRPYIVMPFYPQPNLSVRARRAHFSVAEVLRIGIQIGSAVETSHRYGVLHRDIKPQNILTDSYGDPALTDFGIATTRPGDGPEGLSVPWSPPEILYGTGPGDQRSDVYSLGATLWHLLVGRPPFEQPDGEDRTDQLIHRIASDPPPSTQRADVPSSLERLLRQAMAKDPAGRPQSAMELIRGLQSIEQELRLPLTHPILPADEPSRADTRGSDTVARPAANAGQHPADPDLGQPAGEAAAPPPKTAEPPLKTAEPPLKTAGAAAETAGSAGDQSAWTGETQDATIARGGRRTAPEQPAATSVPPATPVMPDATRKRSPTRPDPRATAGTTQDGADAATTRVRVPVILNPLGSPGPSGSAAPTREHPDVVGSQQKPRRGRVLAFAGGGALLVAVAAVVVLALPRGGGQSPALTGTGQSTQSGGQSALGPGVAAPGQPTVTASRASAGQVEFRWTYANPASGDTFRLQVSGAAGQPVRLLSKPDLLLTVAKGHSACVIVTVRSADGEASQPSNSFCWPN